jgi:hypothetical protein
MERLPPPSSLFEGIWQHRPAEEILRQISALRHVVPRTFWCTPSEGGYTPLLAAAAADAPLAVVQALLEVCPESIHAQTEHLNEIALHLAFREVATRGTRRPRPGVIRCLVEAWPDSVRVRAHTGWLPLHFGVKLMYEFGCEDLDVLAILRGLVEAWPGAVGERFEEGTTALHHLLRCPLPVTRAAVAVLVEAYPAVLDLVDEDGCVPLHHAATMDTVPLEVVQYLVDKRRESLQARSSEGQLPLYFAAVSAVEILHFLAAAWPPALEGTNMHGCLILHAAAASNAPVANIELLIGLWWGAVERTNREGKLSLHTLGSVVAGQRQGAGQGWEHTPCTRRFREARTTRSSSTLCSRIPTPCSSEAKPGCFRSKWRSRGATWTPPGSCCSNGRRRSTIQMPPGPTCSTFCWTFSTKTPTMRHL